MIVEAKEGHHTMAEIGNSLREARIRRKIDITTVESSTKIRAKYLRALETEEFDSLPGPTYVKSFIRTYATYLGLDPNLLVDEYRSRFEGDETHWLGPIGQPQKGRQRERYGRGPKPLALVIAVLAAVVAVLLVLGLTSSDEQAPSSRSGKRTPEKKSAAKQNIRTSKERSKTKTGAVTESNVQKGLAELTVTAKQNVWVCLENNKGKRLIESETLAAGKSRGPFTEKSYKLTLGNGFVNLKLNGKKLPVEDKSPIGYRIDSKGKKPLQQSEMPSCT